MIGKTIKIRGEMTGDEDVLVDGQLEGRIELTKTLTIGRNADVSAEVQAASVSVGGKFQGNILAGSRVEIDNSATVIGNVTSPRISIADGAYFNGSIEMTGRTSDDGKR
jgi:cytoskeletal protein CcmA (bactofilin family)